MAQSLLEQLREMTVVVADTGDLQAIEQFTPSGCHDESLADYSGGSDASVPGDCG